MKKNNWIFALLLAVTVINYPNPFNPKGNEVATFECSSGASFDGYIHIYDLSARLIFQKSVAISAGTTLKTTWDGYTKSNELAGSGVYLYRIINSSDKTSAAKGKIWVINH